MNVDYTADDEIFVMFFVIDTPRFSDLSETGGVFRIVSIDLNFRTICWPAFQYVYRVIFYRQNISIFFIFISRIISVRETRQYI